MKRNSGTLSISSELPINSGFTVRLKVSRRLILVYGLFFMFLNIAVGITDINIWLKLVLWAGIMVYIWSLFKKHLLMLHPHAITGLTLTDFNWCFVCYKNNSIIKADILPDSVLTEHLVILNLLPQEKNTAGIGSLLIQFSTRESVLLTRARVGDTVFKDLKRRLRLLNFNQKNID